MEKPTEKLKCKQSQQKKILASALFILFFLLIGTSSYSFTPQKERAIPSSNSDRSINRLFTALSLNVNPNVSESSNPEIPALSVLSWLHGNWTIETSETILEFNIAQTESGIYLIGRDECRLKTGKTLWKAIRIIVWNPISELFETWEFRSDGTFGEGIMQQFGNQWTAPMKYILADGRTMTAVVNYTPFQDGGFNWTAVSRTLDGLPLPDLGPVNAVKGSVRKAVPFFE